MTDDHEPLDPAEALMREVGAQLRQVRLERGEELDEVAEHLRIKSTYLFGIEQGDLSRIPGRTYALGFLRSYADYLGFDGDDLIVQIKSTVADLTDKTRLRIRTPLPESRLPKTPILVISLAAVAAIYGGWSYLGRSSQLAIETVAEVPGNLRNLALDALSEGNPQAAPPPPQGDDSWRPPPTTTLPAGARAPAGADETRPLGQADAVRPPSRAAAPAAAEAAPSAPAPTTTATATTATASVPAAAPAERPTGALAIDERGLSLVQPEAGAEPPLVATTTARAASGRDAEPAPLDAARQARAPATALPIDNQTATETPPEGTPPAADPEIVAALSPSAHAAEAVVRDATGQVHEVENADARVVLRARDSSWIRISSLSGDYLRTRTLQRGDVFLVPNRSDLELWTGNAGGVEVILDGAVLAPIGDAGAVVREVPLDPPSLRARFGRP